MAIDIRELELGAAALVARAAAGEVITITDRGRPVAQLTPVRTSRLQELIDSGRARLPRRPMPTLPKRPPGPGLADALIAGRDNDRP